MQAKQRCIDRAKDGVEELKEPPKGMEQVQVLVSTMAGWECLADRLWQAVLGVRVQAIELHSCASHDRHSPRDPHCLQPCG